MKPSEPKIRQCTICPRMFIPSRMGQKVCGPACAMKTVRKAKAEAKTAAKAEKAKTRARKEAIKTIPDLIKEAQVAFNAFIRARDAEKTCICCGQPLGSGDVGGSFDCGHYRSTGSASHLRFNEDNAHAQRKVCNRWGAGRAVDYRIGLIQRIGVERVVQLESDNSVVKWTREGLMEIRDQYREKLRKLKQSL